MVHLILNAKSLMQKKLWKCIFRASRKEFFILSQPCTGSWGFPPPHLHHHHLNTFQNFPGSCYKIYLKPYATSRMELFVAKNSNSWELLFIVVIESFVLNVTRLLRSDSETIK